MTNDEEMNLLRQTDGLRNTNLYFEYYRFDNAVKLCDGIFTADELRQIADALDIIKNKNESGKI